MNESDHCAYPRKSTLPLLLLRGLIGRADDCWPERFYLRDMRRYMRRYHRDSETKGRRDNFPRRFLIRSYPIMTGPELAAIRKRLGLSVQAFGRALGYEGQDNTVSVSVRRYEAPNGRPIPPWIARLAIMFDRHGVPDEFLANTEDAHDP